jgi:hypothetical protein
MFEELFKVEHKFNENHAKLMFDYNVQMSPT